MDINKILRHTLRPFIEGFSDNNLFPSTSNFFQYVNQDLSLFKNPLKQASMLNFIRYKRGTKCTFAVLLPTLSTNTSFVALLNTSRYTPCVYL